VDLHKLLVSNTINSINKLTFRKLWCLAGRRRDGEIVFKLIIDINLLKISLVEDAVVEICPRMSVRAQSGLKISTIPFHPKCPGRPDRTTEFDVVGNMKQAMDG
jgi:hypothetical protein